MAEKFINPYNFISFPPEKVRAYSDTDKHTGVIEYSIRRKPRFLYRIQALRLRLRNRYGLLIISPMTFFPTRNWILEKNMRENIMPRLSRAVKCAAW